MKNFGVVLLLAACPLALHAEQTLINEVEEMLKAQADILSSELSRLLEENSRLYEILFGQLGDEYSQSAQATLGKVQAAAKIQESLLRAAAEDEAESQSSFGRSAARALRRQLCEALHTASQSANDFVTNNDCLDDKAVFREKYHSKGIHDDENFDKYWDLMCPSSLYKTLDDLRTELESLNRIESTYCASFAAAEELD